MKGFTPTGAAKSATGARQSIAIPRAYKFDITFIKKGKFERFLTRKRGEHDFVFSAACLFVLHTR